MKKFKKLAGLLLALVMVCALGVTAFAADNYTITINYSESGHTYEAYQIFTGDLYETYTEYTESSAPTDGTTLYTYDSTSDTYSTATYDENYTGNYYVVSNSVLSNVEWGSGVDGTALLTALQKNTTVVGTHKYSKVTNLSAGDTISGTYYELQNGKMVETTDTTVVSGKTYYTASSEDVNVTVAELFAGCATAADVAEVLSNNNTNATLAEVFAQLASENLTTVAETSSGGTQNSDGSYSYTISGLSAGYYLVKDKDNTVTAEGDSYTDIILEVVTNVAVTAKADTTTLDKEVESTTDSTYETAADYDIGDNVPFTLIATLPSNYSSYTTYKLTFHDTLSDGLSFNNDVEVTVYTAVLGSDISDFDSGTYYELQEGGMVETTDTTSTTGYSEKTYYTATGVESGYTVVYGYTAVSISSFESGITYYTTTDNVTYTEVADASGTPDSGTTYYVKTEDTCTFEVRIADANSLADKSGNTIPVSSSSLIVVTYTAELLNSAATIETNAAYLEYSNNPNGDGTGTTTTDKTTVITFTLDVDKVDSSSNPLEGAGFTLYKLEEANTSSGFTNGVTYYTCEYESVTDTSRTPDHDTTYYAYTAVGSEVTAGYKTADTTNGSKTGVTYYTYDPNNDVYTKVTDTTGTPDSSTTYYVKNNFTFNGLAVGYYKLVETTTPSGYNTMEDLYFQVVATTEEKSEEGSVTTLKILDEDGNDISSSTFEVSNTSLTISTEIVNTAGSRLPSTGGIGTTIFYVIGSIMVFGAVVVLITRRRMKAE